jgi:HAD superfamily hydrolase (TIGR01509 family)
MLSVGMPFGRVRASPALMKKAVIFDIDGTLIDSVDQHASAWKEAFEHFGFHFPLPDIRYQIGKGGDKLVKTFLSEDEIAKHGKQIEEFRGEVFKRKFADRLRPFPGVRELFESLHGKGLKIGLATSAKKEEVDRYEKLLKIEGLVDAVTTKDDVEHSKPDPDVLEIVRRVLGNLEPADCVFVGDSPHDATAAVRDGMHMVGVLCGGFPESDLREAGAQEIFRDPEDLLNRWYTASLRGAAQ